MPQLSSAKTLGGIGAILTLLILVPTAGFILNIIGWILILIALKYIADIVNDRSIFNNAIVAAILTIVGVVAGALLVIGSVFQFFNINGYTIGSITSTTTPPSDLVGLIGGIVAGLAVIWIFTIISSIFLRRSLDKVSHSLNVNMFNTAALLYLIGAALTIILIGFVLLFIAEILLVVAFFSIPDNPPQVPMGQPQMMGQPPPTPAPSTS
jgi:uncharacterized membrane protein